MLQRQTSKHFGKYYVLLRYISNLEDKRTSCLGAYSTAVVQKILRLCAYGQIIVLGIVWSSRSSISTVLSVL